MTHLRPDEVVDAVEGALAATRRHHVESCGACQREVEAMAALLDEARLVSVPEPSPLFWDHLASRVRAAVAVDVPPPSTTIGWFRWPVLIPVAGLAVLVLAIASAVMSFGTGPVPAVEQVLTEGQDAGGGSDMWDVLTDLVGPLDVETAQAAGIATRVGSAEQVVLHLSAAEQEALVTLLEQELRAPRAGS